MTDRRIAAGLFLVTLVTFGYFFGGGGWNQNAQFDLTRAIVERGTLYVDGYDVNTGDLSAGRHGHRYINKPPGVSLLAVIPYAIVYSVERALHVAIDDALVMTFNAWFVTFLTCGVCGALIAVVLYLEVGSVWIALAAAFGTIVFPYSTMLFAHVPSALFLLLAFVWRDRRPLLAGISAGIAGACFYFCIAAAIVILAVMRSRHWKFILGAVPIALLLGWYHYVCFGSPWRTSVEQSNLFANRDLLFGVLARPSAEALWGITFSPYRGLFYCSPVLLLAFFGVRRIMRRDLIAIAAIAAIFLILTASFNGWNGGSAFGPRYLLPVIPLLAIPMSRAPRLLIIPLAIISILINFAATAVDPMPSAALRDPLRMYIVPPLLTGHLPDATVRALKLPSSHAGKVGINVQSIDEIGPFVMHPAGSREGEWASFNLGELLFGSGGRSSLIPIALWMIVGSAWLLRRAGSSEAAG